MLVNDLDLDSLCLDPESPTFDADLDQFLQRRAALVEKALSEGDTVLLGHIISCDQQNLTQLKSSRARIAAHLSNLSHVKRYVV